jgi:NTP pyrophosphatase (non-canonical NTP hydrolase)
MSQDFKTLAAKALAVRDHYDELQEKDGQPRWDVSDRMAGFIGDAGDLSKLIMMKQGRRRAVEDLDVALKHEVTDCLWSVIVIADELGMDLEGEFSKTMDELHARIERQKENSSALS